MRMSVLGDALKTLSNAEKRGKRQVLLRPSSKVVVKVLQVMQSHGMSFVALRELVDLLQRCDDPSFRWDNLALH